LSREEYASLPTSYWWFPKYNTSKEISVPTSFFSTINAVKIDTAVTTKD
jgi:hypothetical protein